MGAGSGPTWREPFASYDRASSSWRTSQPSLFEDLLASPPTWPKSGTWDLGAAYERPTSAPPTAASACSSSPSLLPTPNATDGNGGPRAVPAARTSRGPDHGPRLRDVAPLLPTPTSNISGRTGEQHMAMRRSIGRNTPSQLEAAAQLLPTPTARLGDDTSRGADPARYKGPQSMNGRRSNLDDCIAAVETKAPWLLPTPQANDARGNGDAARLDRPHHPWNLRDHIMTLPSSGEPTSPPSAAGKPPSVAQRPRQLSLDELDSD